ncbi:MAG: nickel pincer cofactor biosynthesis protein LarC [Pseudomonadota bacterium]
MSDGKTLFYQPACGISGDMHLAVLIDLGLDPDTLRQELSRLGLNAQFELQIERAAKQGIYGTRVRVIAQDETHHRHYADIVERIQAAQYAPAIEARALAIFHAIAVAEADIHDVDIERVHFHEVGAVDSIVDIVGAAIGLEALGVRRCLSQAVEVGGGTVRCAHGVLPVPAPATQRILAGVPCDYGGVDGESTTPTGAAILRASVDAWGDPKGLTIERTAIGVGHKDFANRPNVLRASLVTESEATGAPKPSDTAMTADTHFKLEANIDDMAPEAFDPLLADLFAAGAGDAWCTPIVMKKGRPAILLSALADGNSVARLRDLILNRSTTIGLRILPFTKHTLPRETLSVTTSVGEVRVKRVTQPDGRTRWKSEHDDVARCAAQAELDYLRARRIIDAEIAARLDDA